MSAASFFSLSPPPTAVNPFSPVNEMTPAVVAHEKAAIANQADKKDGTANPSGVDELLNELRQDEDLSVFLEDGFNPFNYVGQVVREGRVDGALRNSERAQEILSARVREEVIQRKEALIAEVEAVAVLEKEVSTVTEGVSELSVASNALVEALEGPYVPMETAVQRMQNLCDASDLIAAVSRFRFCTKKLSDAGLLPIDSSMAANPTVLPPAAEAMKELELLIAPSSVPKLEKVDGLLKVIMAVRKASPEVRRRAAVMLKNGLHERNQVEVEAGVLAFFSLGVLPDRVNSEIARLLSKIQSDVHRGLEGPKAVNEKQKKSASTSNLISAAAEASANRNNHNIQIWNNIEKMFDAIAEACCKAILLQQVLSKKYSDVTHLSLLHEPIASGFIEATAKALTEQIAVLCRSRQQRPAANLVFLALAEGFPKLRASLNALVSRIEEFARLSPQPITNMKPNAKFPFVPKHDFIENAFFGSITEIETHYLSVSLDRLMNAVEHAFGKRKHPAESDALAFAKLLAHELQAAKDDVKLLETATSNVATALRLYKSHAEDAAAVTAPDVDHRRNNAKKGKNKSRDRADWHLITLHNGVVALVTYARRVLGMTGDGSGRLAPAIAKEVEDLEKLAGHFLDGPFSQTLDEARRTLGRMHTENLELDASDEGYSVYVLTVGKQLRAFADNVVARLARYNTLGIKSVALARNIVEAFVRQVSLVKPCSDVVRLALSSDIAHLELSIEAICPVRGLGDSYRGLRAMRSMLLIPISDLVQPNEDFLGDLKTLPRSCVVSALICRANTNGLDVPYQKKGVSVHKYFDWMKTQNEEALWEDIEEVLDEYKKKNNISAEERCEEFKAIQYLIEIL